MKKMYVASMLLLFTTSYIQTSSFLETPIFDNPSVITINPLLTDDENNQMNVIERTLAGLEPEQYQNHPPFNPALGSPCWQAIKSYYSDTNCSDIKTCCLRRNNNINYSHLPKPVAQYRECCMDAEDGCCKAVCLGVCFCAIAVPIVFALNGCAVPPYL